MLVLVVIAGGLGAVGRYWADTAIKSVVPWPAPLATAIINVMGSFLLGLLAGMGIGNEYFAVLGFGFCGGFTTFSTASVEVGRLLFGRNIGYAFGYCALMCLVSVLGAWCGMVTGTFIS